MSECRICSAYEEFLKDEHGFDQCVNSTNTEQKNQIIQATESNNELCKSKPASNFTRRQSQRLTIAKQHLPDYYYYYQHRRRSLAVTRNSKNTTNQSKTSEKRKTLQSSNVNSSSCNDQTSQHIEISTSRVESFNTQQRMEVDSNTERKLPDISKELNVSQHPSVSTSKNMDGEAMADGDLGLTLTFDNSAVIPHSEQQTMPIALSSETNTAQNSTRSPNSQRKTIYRSIIVLNDFSDLLKSELSKKNVHFDLNNEHS